MQVAVRAELPRGHVHNGTRDSKAQALTASRFGQDERVDADQFAADIHEWTAAVAVIDRCVRLDVHHRVIRVRLPRDGADDAHRHGIAEPFGAAEGENELALLQRVVIGERRGRQSGEVHLQQREVDLGCHADHAGLHVRPRAPASDRMGELPLTELDNTTSMCWPPLT